MDAQNKNSRRKRGDPQSRDFICKCGKSYLSYAAAYTHVKNKHKSEKEYLQNIAKPQRERLKRGRPRQRKPLTSTLETESLSVIEEAILKIFSALKDCKELEFGKVILEGNQEVTEKQLDEEYIEFAQKRRLDFNLFENPEKYPQLDRVVQFEQKLNKHFSAAVSARIRWYLNYLVEKRMIMSDAKVESDSNQLDIKFEDPETIKVFEGTGQINQIVLTSLKKWMDMMDKAVKEEDE